MVVGSVLVSGGVDVNLGYFKVLYVADSDGIGIFGIEFVFGVV